MNILFQYAVKFVCGKTEGEVVAPGQYWTAINVHNPSYRSVPFRFKIAVALPHLEQGPISSFYDAKLGPDGALEIDCEDIRERSQHGSDFLKGFVVIQSREELDIVAVYTAAGSDGRVETLHTATIEPRRIQVGQPDLVPMPDENGFFCRRDDKGNLLVTVHNQGTDAAGPSTTRVDFGAHGSVDMPTPPLTAGASVTLRVPIPLGCFDPDCSFRIAVDVHHVVAESNEGNNFASGTCLG